VEDSVASVNLEDHEWAQLISIIATTLVQGHPVAGKMVSQLASQRQQTGNGHAAAPGSPGWGDDPRVVSPRVEAQVEETDYRDSGVERPPRPARPPRT
jgi:hypothetical protein